MTPRAGLSKFGINEQVTYKGTTWKINDITLTEQGYFYSMRNVDDVGHHPARVRLNFIPEGELKEEPKEEAPPAKPKFQLGDRVIVGAGVLSGGTYRIEAVVALTGCFKYVLNGWYLVTEDNLKKAES